MNKKLLVFLRAYNDIDHITPILYKWLIVTDIPVDVVITSNRSFLNDYRIKLLNQFQNFTLYHVDDFLSKAERKMKNKLQIDRMLDYIMGAINKGIIVFDWTFRDFVKLVSNSAKERGYKTVSLPHGDRPFYNLIKSGLSC